MKQRRLKQLLPLICVIGLIGFSAVCFYTVSSHGRTQVGGEAIPGLRVTAPFTLAYRVDSRFVTRLPSYPRDADLRPVIGRVSISCNGTALLYQCNNQATHLTSTTLCERGKAYSAWSDSKLASIFPGFSMAYVPYAPVAGVNLPYIPLMSSTFKPRFLPAIQQFASGYLNIEKKFVDPRLYNQARQTRYLGVYTTSDKDTRHFSQAIVTLVTTNERGRPKALWLAQINQNSPGFIWQYYDYQLFSGVWLPKRIHFLNYSASGPKQTSLLTQDATYTLESASNQPLPANAYLFETYLAANANITDSSEKAIKSFYYQKGEGTLTEQESRAGFSDVHYSRRTNGGIAAFSLIFIAISFWLFWRSRRVRTRIV